MSSLIFRCKGYICENIYICEMSRRSFESVEYIQDVSLHEGLICKCSLLASLEPPVTPPSLPRDPLPPHQTSLQHTSIDHEDQQTKLQM